MKDLFSGIGLILAGVLLIFVLEKFKINNVMRKGPIQLWMAGIVLVVFGIYVLLVYFGVDLSV